MQTDCLEMHFLEMAANSGVPLLLGRMALS